MGEEWGSSVLKRRIDLLQFIISDVIWDQKNPAWFWVLLLSCGKAEFGWKRVMQHLKTEHACCKS